MENKDLIPDKPSAPKKAPKYSIPQSIKPFLPDEISAKTLTEAQLGIAIVELKKCGYSIDMIGFILSMKRRDVVKRLRKFIKRAAKTMYTATEDYITQEELRLEGLLLSLRPKIDIGDVKAIEVALRVSESLRRLKGLDAPERKQIMQQTQIDIQSHSIEELRVRAVELGIPIEYPQLETYVLPGEEVPEMIEEKKGETE